MSVHCFGSECEWNPETNMPATRAQGCKNRAVFSVGSRKDNNYHICASCAELPRFRRFKRKLLIQSGPQPAEATP